MAFDWNAKELSIWQRFKYRWFTQAGNFVKVPVANGGTSVVVPFLRTEQDTNYGVHVGSTWNTLWRVATADKLVNQVTIRFGTAAGASDTVDVSIFRSED